MKTAVDSSVLLDVIVDDPQWAETSEEALKKAFAAGQLVIGEVVLAEITPVFSPGDLDRFLSDWRIQYQPSSIESAKSAGEMYARYLGRNPAGKPKRVLPDFLIGAHALHHAGRLLARDRGYYRDYFSELEVIEPSGITDAL